MEKYTEKINYICTFIIIFFLQLSIFMNLKYTYFLLTIVIFMIIINLKLLDKKYILINSILLLYFININKENYVNTIMFILNTFSIITICYIWYKANFKNKQTNILKIIMYSGVFISIISIFGGLIIDKIAYSDFYPTSTGRLYGIFDYPNSLAIYTLVSYIICLYFILKEDKIIYKICFLTLLLCFFLCISKMNIILFILTNIVIYIFKKNKKQIKYLILSFIPLCILINKYRIYMLKSNILLYFGLFVLCLYIFCFLSNKKINKTFYILIVLVLLIPLPIRLNVLFMNNKSEAIIAEFNNIEQGKKYNISYNIKGDNVKTRLVKVIRHEKNIISRTEEEFKSNTINYSFIGEDAELYYLTVITDEKFSSFSIGDMYLESENKKEKHNLDYLILPYNYIEQIKQVKHDKGSISGRKDIYKDSFNIIKTNLLFGHGYGYFRKMSIANNYSHLALEEHSEVLKILVEIGLVGFIIIFYIVIKCILVLFRIINEEKGIFYLCIFLSLLFCGTFDLVLSEYNILLILIMIMSLIFSNYKDIKKNKIIFISSAGGHLTEILNLKKIFKEYNSILITEKNGIKLNLDIETKYLIYCSRFYFFKYIFIAPINVIKSVYYFIRYNPDLIVTFGAHTSVPLCYLAWIFGRKIIFIEVFDRINTPTLSGVLVYPIADKFIVQHKSLKRVYKKSIYIHGGYL